MSCSDPSRRRFLHLVAQSGAVAGVLALGVGCGSGGATGKVSGGNISDLAEGVVKVVPGESLALGRDAKGVWAMTLICTHAGCDMSSQGSVSASAVVCSCHNSKFDANGAVTQGPAGSPLEHYAVAIDSAGAITIDASTVVDAATRTPVGTA
jgi:Rieske Fe-S protein